MGEQSAGVTRPPHVLVVDDEPTVLRSCSRLLASAGFAVDCASNGREARAMLDRAAYDLLITDIAMPEMDGIALLQSVRARDASMPVILMTGAPTLNSAVEAITHGVARYLLKPVDPQELRAVAAQAIAAGRQERIRQAQELDARLSSGTTSVLDAAFEHGLSCLHLAFQPIIAVANHRVMGYSALPRTRDGSFPTPCSLLEAAQALERACDVGRTVRGLVAQHVALLPAAASLLVSLHPLDFNDPDLYAPDAPLGKVAEHVVFEITERAALHAVNDLPRAVGALREQGFRIAIGDLGAGYSGLASFAQLEPDLVKFDVSIVKGVDASAMKQKLIRSMTVMCNEMGIGVIAEGVSTVQERDTLVSLGCGFLQGSLFAAPGDAFPTPSWGLP